MWGAGLGAGLWLIGMVGLLPRHRSGSRPGWRATGQAQVINIMAHLLFGLAGPLAAQEVLSPQEGSKSPTVG